MAVIGTLVAKLAMDKTNFVQGTQAASQQTGFLQKNMLAIGAAGLVVGGAMEMAARKQAPLTEQTQRLSNALGMTTKEVRDLALSMSDVTFPIGEVLELMEIGRQRGITSAAALKEYAEFWDMVGDATGEASDKLAQSAVALEHAGISAENQAEALAALGYIQQETTAGVDEFLRFVGRVGSELQGNTPHIDEMAAALGALEDQGYEARLAQRELQSALRETGGDMGAALEIMGVTSAQFEEYTQQVAESSDVIETNAEAHANSYTMMQKLQSGAENLMYKYGDLIGVVGDFAPLMMALGPILKGVTVLKGALGAVSLKAVVPGFIGAAKATWAFTAALLANPITWVVMAIVGLIAIIVLLIKNWDKVADAFRAGWDLIKQAWEGIKDFFSAIWDWLKDLFADWGPELLMILAPFIGIPLYIYQNWEEIKQWFYNLWENVKEIFSNALQWFTDLPGQFLEWGRDIITNIWEGIKSAWDRFKDNIANIGQAIKDFFNPFAKSSPSLIELVQRGTVEITRAYEGAQAPRNQARQAAVAGVGGSSGAVINNNFNISELVIREEADIKRVAKDLHDLQEDADRSI